METATSRGLRDAVHGLHEAESLEDLGAAFRRGVAPLVPADLHEIFVFGTGDAAVDLWLGSPGGYSASERAELLDDLDDTPEQHPIVRHWEKHETAGPMRVSDLISLRTWRCREFYQLFNRHWSHDYEMAALLEGATPCGVAGFTVVRATKDITDAEIAAILAMSKPTVSTHVGRVLRKLEADTPPSASSAAPSRQISGLRKLSRACASA